MAFAAAQPAWTIAWWGSSALFTEGGTHYTQFPSDAYTLAEAFLLGTEKTHSDTYTLAEASPRHVGTTLTDLLSLLDAPARTSAFLRTLAETTTLDETFTQAVALPQSDTVSLDETFTQAVALPQSDTVSLTDDVSRVVAALRALEETIGLAEALTRVEARKALSDALTASDQADKAARKVAADSFALSDQADKAARKVAADSFALSDADARTVAALRTFLDAMELSETVEAGTYTERIERLQARIMRLLQLRGDIDP